MRAVPHHLGPGTPTTIGELGGSANPRIREVAGALEASGFPTVICADMDALLKTHVAEINPTACALYMAGTNAVRLGRTRDAIVLTLKAIREGYRVLATHGVPVTLSSHRVFEWIPEPVLLPIMQCRLGRDETPVLDRLVTHLDRSAEPVPDGSAEFSLRWQGVWALGVGVLGVGLTALVGLRRRIRASSRHRHGRELASAGSIFAPRVR